MMASFECAQNPKGTKDYWKELFIQKFHHELSIQSHGMEKFIANNCKFVPMGGIQNMKSINKGYCDEK